jgi:translation elongation factor EF-1alpha
MGADYFVPSSAKSHDDEIQGELTRILGSIGDKFDLCKFVSISAFVGDNLVGHAGTSPKRPFERSLHLPIRHVYKITGMAIMRIGCVDSPVGIVTDVKSIEVHHDESATAHNLSSGISSGRLQASTRLPAG